MARRDEGDMTVREAGRKGGEATARTHGHEFYEEIGHKGGEIGGPRGGQRVRELIEKGKELEEQ
ncbi:MAG TPA: Em GEA1 (EM1) [Armatimonadota bacterium]|jgi:general stress protein YciG|nr:Em GEA1 (EM1) [Armatimonadota bacterium]HOJ22008.1 Em GEA1 (EM1) [Armatimonadota bacterium]HOM83551.1 Em GEA1 (EM1) [Armatimonadota bacterium]HOQ29605.1 Em GEA1 (EM1) [Armatimonadota bacterium]HPO74293.1 Em GEA1 (EM1) [Armatimonadota bacterium]